MIGFLLLTSIHIQTVETAVISTSTVSRCGIGFFQESWPNGSESCLPCSRCPVNSVETQTCADDHDTICSCPEGKYLFKGQCRTCRKCRRGSGVTQKCQGENNTICKPCIRGAFSAKKSHVTTCQKCRQCDPHEARVRKCTTTSDTICGDCKKGYFRSTYLNQCWKCSYCYPQHPNLTATVPECARNGGNPDYICMPLERPPFGFSRDDIQVSDSVSISPNITVVDVTVLPANSGIPKFLHVVIWCVIGAGGVLSSLCCLAVLRLNGRSGRKLKMNVSERAHSWNPLHKEEHLTSRRDSAISRRRTNISTQIELGNISINEVSKHVSENSLYCEEHDNMVLQTELSTEEPLLETHRLNPVHPESVTCVDYVVRTHEKLQTSRESRSERTGFPVPRTTRCPLRDIEVQHCL